MSLFAKVSGECTAQPQSYPESGLEGESVGWW